MAPILLTGVSGYLGAAIGAALEEQGIAYDVLPCRLEQLKKKSLCGYKKVIHAAGAPRYRGRAAMDQSNRAGTGQLLSALEGRPDVLFISTRLVYGHQPARTCTEDDPAQPADAYGVAKLAAEKAIVGSGFPHAILRIPGLMGDSPAGIGHGFLAKALRHFLAGEAVVRHIPDRMHDNLDVRALARVCAEWTGDALQLAQGVTNITGSKRSLHGTLAEFAAVAEQFGGRPLIQDRFAAEMPWPFMSDQRFLRMGGSVQQRPDAEIAAACFRKLVIDDGPDRHWAGLPGWVPDRPAH